MTGATLLKAQIDGEGRVVHADPAFAAINARAGGGERAVLAVPQFATLVRLARRLGIPVSRAVTIADGEADVDCWVRAVPLAGGVALSVSLLRERAAWHPPAPVVAAAAAILGKPLTRLFALVPEAGGALPLIEAMAERRDFDRQPATIRAGGEHVLLSGNVRIDPRGGFAGFVGGTHVLPASAALSFNERLERILRESLGRIVADADAIRTADAAALPSHYAGYAGDIAGAARHLLGLVDDLLDLEAIERDDFAIAVEPVDPAQAMRRAATLLAPRAIAAGVTIEHDHPDPPPLARGDFRRLVQIMVNLIGNALRYAAPGDTVTIALRRAGDRVLATVADRGPGIAAADHERIFEKFARIDPAEPGGSGLGLYIARRLARAMQGDLTVESAPGAGARFTVSLAAA